MMVDDVGTGVDSNPCPRFLRLTSLWYLTPEERLQFHAVIMYGDEGQEKEDE
jgi:hypothetical protein